MLRFGLCCTFQNEPIAFRTTTAAALSRLSRRSAHEKLAGILADNAIALEAALRFCAAMGIGCFRINSSLLPLRTHPKAGYIPQLLPGGRELIRRFQRCGELARELDLRVTLHPDQFVVLNSPDPAIVENSIEEIEHQAEVATWTATDVLILHGGGGYGDKVAALERFAATVERLSPAVRTRLAIENDERVFTPADLLPLCSQTTLPLVYDVHHHRCLPDGMSVADVTNAAIATWCQKEPLFHISSPLAGWDGPKPARHHDFIDPSDFPDEWLNRDLTVEVEAKAKEIAVLRLIANVPASTPVTTPKRR